MSHKKLPILFIDDEPEWLTSVGMALHKADLSDFTILDDSRKVLPLLKKQDFCVVVLDLMMPHISGEELLDNICKNHPHIPVIITTAISDIDVAIRCLKKGAYDYLVKPIEYNKFINSLKKACEFRETWHESKFWKSYLFGGRKIQLREKEAFSSIVTNNEKMKVIFQYIEIIASSPQPVLITGETGVGKELIARAIHRLGGMRGNFVPVNIAGMDSTMFLDTLFGHKKGAFTGADSDRDGLISKACDGIIFLDEIGSLDDTSQVKLLRLIQEGEYYPLGSDNLKHSNAKVICATNAELEELISTGKFRKDLYYRLSVHHIHVPPLRERLDDLPLLVDHFIRLAAEKLKKEPPLYPPELITLLKTYNFPGNIRELENMIFDAVTINSSKFLSLNSFKKIIKSGRLKQRLQIEDDPQKEGEGILYRCFGRFPTLKEMEGIMVSEAMKLANNNQGIAASLLGITRQALNKRLKKMEI